MDNIDFIVTSLDDYNSFVAEIWYQDYFVAIDPRNDGMVKTTDWLLFTPHLVIAGLTRNPQALSVTRGSRIKSGMTNLNTT